MLAIKITGITEKDFASVASAMFVKYAKDMFRWPQIVIKSPDGRPTVVGFSNQYDRVTSGGTGYLRLELYLKSETEIEGFQKDYEATLRTQLKKLPASVQQESVVVLSEEFKNGK